MQKYSQTILRTVSTAQNATKLATTFSTSTRKNGKSDARTNVMQMAPRAHIFFIAEGNENKCFSPACKRTTTPILIYRFH